MNANTNPPSGCPDRRGICSSAALLIFTLTAALAGQPAYRVSYPSGLAGGSRCAGAGLSQLGDVTGACVLASGALGAFYEPAGGAAVPAGGLVGRVGSSGRAVNDSGRVAGEASGYAYVWDAAGGARQLDPRPARPHAINQRGIVAGTLYPDFLLRFSPVVWDAAGVPTELVPSANGRAYDINDRGEVTGYAGARAFRASPAGVVTYLTMPAPFGFSYGMAINRHGQVAGVMKTASGNTEHAFFDDGTVVHDLGRVGDNGRVYGVNAGGIVVGERVIVGSQAFVASVASGMRDLNTLIPAGTGLSLRSARDINDAGQILVHALDGQGMPRMVRLDPLSGTAAVAPLGVGCGARPVVPQLDGDEPRLGTRPTLRMVGGVPGSMGALLLGTGRPSLRAAGACTVYPSPDVVVPFVTGVRGGLVLGYAVPATAAISGLVITAQTVVTDGAGGLEWSNGLLLIAGS